MRRRPAILILVLAGFAFSGLALARDLTTREIANLLFNARPGVPTNLAARDLSFLDLSALDFKGANLAGANLYGADLTAANLRGANLADAILDRTTIVGTDFSSANLAGAWIRLPHSAGSPAYDKGASPRFSATNLTSARIVARLDGADFRDAVMSNIDLAPYADATQNTTAQHSVMIGCDFTGAALQGANLSNVVLRFANFENANLSGANLAGADLTGASLANADLTGAILDGAIMVDTKLSGVRGLVR